MILRESSCNFLNVINLRFASYSDVVRLLVNGSPTAFCFNAQIVSVHLDSEKSSLPPVCSPTVPNNPILNSILFAPTNNCNLVVWNGKYLCLRVDSTSIGFKFFIGFNTTRNGSSSEDLSFHSFSTNNDTVLSDFPNWVTRCCPTGTFVSWFLSLWVSAISTSLNG